MSVVLIPEGIDWHQLCPECGELVDNAIHVVRAGGAEDTTVRSTCPACGWSETQNAVAFDEDDEDDEEDEA
jgi:predicted RNA-binding Zn-ribbon protein involved in translation (DUF1610 family)